MQSHVKMERPRQKIIYCVSLILTGIVFLILFEILFRRFGLLSYFGLSPNEFGDTIAGFAGIFAFIWLIAGYFLQRQELELNTAAIQKQAEEIRASVKQLEIQNKSLKETELFTKRDVIIKIINMKYDQINYHIIRLVSGQPTVSDHTHGIVQQGYSIERACCDIFCSMLFSDNRARGNLKTGGGRSDLQKIIEYCVDILNLADQMDDEGMVRSTIENGIYGDIYLTACDFLEVQPEFQKRR